MHESLADGFITKYADPLCLLGVGFGLVTAYIMFDIDRGSRNHPSNDPRAFERFLATLHKIGLTTPVIIQSSGSGGIHVYYFFDRDINTFRIASLSQVTLIDANFAIKDGTLELFPNCKPHGNKSNHKPHRSPLQPNNGGLILDRKGNPLLCGANLNHETQLAAFLEMAKASAHGNNIDKILRKLDPVYNIFKGNPSKYRHIHKKHESEVAKEWRENLEVLMSIGWTGFHQTNNLIHEFIEYGVVFLGLDNKKDLFDWAFEAITSANGYEQYCRHQHQIEPRIWDWIDSTLKKGLYVPYCGHPTRSSDRDKFIAQYKTSKSLPTNKAEVYTRKRVEQTVERLEQTVEIILATISSIPSRIGDVIKLIQATSREKFGTGFSNPTLYKEHFKFIWVKLIDTKKASDIVPATSITLPNMGYFSKTPAETAFESSVLDVTGLPKTNLKPIGGETSHRAFSICSVNASSRPTPANQADPDLTPASDSKTNVLLDSDLDRDLEPKHISFNPTHFRITNPTDWDNLIEPDSTHSQSALVSELSNSDTSYQTDLIEPSTADLTSRLVHDRDKPIEPDPIQSDRLEGDLFFNLIDPDLIDLQSASAVSLPNLDSNSQADSIEPPGANLIIRSVHNYPQPIQPNPTDQDKSIQPIQPIQQDPIEPDSIQSDPIQLNPIQLNPIQLNPIQLNSLDRDKSIEPDLSRNQTYTQSPTISNSFDLDIDPQPNQIELFKADLTSRSTYNQNRPIELDPDYPSLKYFKKLLLEQKLKLTYQQLTEIRLSRFQLTKGSIVRPRDIYHVHGDDRGTITQIQPWGVYVLWSDGTDGRYSVDDLIQTIIP